MMSSRSRAGTPNTTVPLHPLLEEWAGELATLNRSPKTIKGYLVDLGQYFEWLGRRDPLGVTAQDVRRYAHTMQAAGLAPRTRARRTTAIRTWYRYLAKTRRVAESPADEIAPPRPKKNPPSFLRDEEVRKLRRALPRDNRGLRDRAIIELGLSSLRISEPLSLDLDDVFLDRRQIRITGKGGDRAVQPIGKAVARALQAWLERRPECRSQAVFIPLPPRGPGCRLEYTTVEKNFRRYLKAAGINRRIRFHDLRHTLGVRLANRGVPLQYIQDLFRHKSPQTTRIYTDVAKEHLAEVLDREGEFPE